MTLLRHETDTAYIWAEYKTTEQRAVVSSFCYEVDFSVAEEDDRDHLSNLIQLVQQHSGMSEVVILEDANIWA